MPDAKQPRRSRVGLGTFAGRMMRVLWIYTPWQVFFAFVLTKVLKPV